MPPVAHPVRRHPQRPRAALRVHLPRLPLPQRTTAPDRSVHQAPLLASLLFLEHSWLFEYFADIGHFAIFYKPSGQTFVDHVSWD